MSNQITLTLPDELYRQAELLAQESQCSISEVLLEILEFLLSPTKKPISNLSDSEIIALTQLRMQSVQEQRLNQLLDRQQAGTITETEREELQALIHIYEDKLLQQSQALNEAVRRGLIEPLKG